MDIAKIMDDVISLQMHGVVLSVVNLCLIPCSQLPDKLPLSVWNV